MLFGGLVRFTRAEVCFEWFETVWEQAVTQSDKRILIKASIVIMLATLLSRVFGLVRMQVINYHFPQELLDPFWAAYKIPNTLRELLAEGALSVAFIPVFSACLAKRGVEDASLLASRVLNALVLVVLAVVGLGILTAPLYMPVYVSGFSTDAVRVALAVELGQLMMPFLLLASAGAVVMGVLNGRQHFAAPAFAPVMFSIGMILTVWLFGDRGVYVLGWGVLAGGVLQLLFQLPFLRGHGIRYTPSLSLRDPGVREVLGLMLPAALALGVVQLNQLFVPFFASWNEGGMSALQNAILLVQMPQGVFAIAISTALLPGLSRQASLGDMEGFRRGMANGLALVIFFMVPAALFFVFFRVEIVDAIFNLGGKFDAKAVQATAESLYWYSLGLIGMGGTVLANRFFYGMRDTRTPLLVALASVLVNILCNVLFHLTIRDTAMIALANSIAVTVNFILLMAIISRRTGGLDWSLIGRESAKILIAASVMSVAVAAVSALFGIPETRTVSFAILRFGVMLVVAVVSFVAVAALLKVGELGEILSMIRARLGRRGRANP